MYLQWRRLFVVSTFSMFALGAAALARADAKPEVKLDLKPAAFGKLVAPRAEIVRTQAFEWLKEAGKTDAVSVASFEAIWSSDRSLLERVTETLVLGDAEAARLMEEARDQTASAPIEVPAAIRDAKRSAFYRSNLGLAYAKTLAMRRVYEEALETFDAVRPEQVVDPATYFFHRAVAEHDLGKQVEAERSIAGLFDDVSDCPERYQRVAQLMHDDMATWQEKSLGAISRKMSNVERRLEFARGGKETQKQQREILNRLDELIKELENQSGGGGGGGGANGGGQQGKAQGKGPSDSNQPPQSPMQDSQINTGQRGLGEVDGKKLQEAANQWGKLPDKEKVEFTNGVARDLPPHLQDVTREYIRRVNDK